ncbi:MAG TPA: DNA mismatch repair endonuclease MutL [Armatimonadota bacterium]|nr:DNA mismatch repair endonuclease MutL [Armatimonadota bacterium]
MQDKQRASTIRVLDEGTVNKIAAGEVIERPASVVKELIENALDAQADEIKIELLDGGKRLIRVTDNGTGMSREDAVLSIQRHATSKIESADDLFAIHTLGFRGEALPSMASVSRLEIVTRRDGDDCGTLVICAGGESVEVLDIGAPVGTSVSVSELFYSVPARQKFLKTAQTELGHVVELVNRFAISHCEVDMTLVHNERTVFSSPGSNRLEDAILTVFGRDAAEAVIPIMGRSGPYSVHGFVSRPSYSKPGRSGQMFFVNQRFVRNRNLIHALDDAYRGILPQGRFPLFVGFVEVDPQLVDVNVHPTKIEVKFTREWEAHKVLSASVREALSSSAVTPSGLDSLPAAVRPIQRPSFVAPEKPSGPAPDLAAFREALASRLGQKSESLPQMEQAAAVPDAGPAESSDWQSDPLSGACVLAQARNMYIVAQSPQGLLLIDQHVAHERILYDELTNMGTDVHAQRLMMPLTLELGRREAMVLESKLADLRSLGFDIEPFGKDTFVVRSVPALIAEKNYEQILRDTIEELTELTLAKRLMVQREAILVTTACKMAVKAGDHLSSEEMVRLVADLRHTSNPYLCPHGRPIVVCISNRELDKMFGRV